MSRIRSVHPGFFADEAIASLPMEARLLLIGIWTEADDHGIFEWKPFLLKTRIFPAETFSLSEIEAMMVQIASANCIQKFEEGSSKTYGAIRNFCVFQRPREPSYRHPFPEWCGSYVGIDRRKGTDLKQGYDSPASGPEQSSNIPTAKSPHRRGEERIGVGGKKKKSNTNTQYMERESLGNDEKPSPSAPDALTVSDSGSGLKEGKKGSGLARLGAPLPADWIPSPQLLSEIQATLGMSEDSIKTELLAFHARMAAADTLSANWNASFVTWCKRWYDHQQQLAAKTAPPRIGLSRNSPSAPSEPRVSAGLWTPSEKDWDGAVALYAKTDHWSAQFGPAPQSANCRAPRAILEKHGIDPTSGEKRRDV
jgi:hypothetical protein